jgi:hypothetical protein
MKILRVSIFVNPYTEPDEEEEKVVEVLPDEDNVSGLVKIDIYKICSCNYV